jgi:hypothetical protein
MGTLDNFGVDENVNSWLSSYLIDGPMGALPDGRKEPFVPSVCSVTTMLDRQTGLIQTVVLMDGGRNTKPRPPVQITAVPELRKLLTKIAPDDREIWGSAFVKFIETPDVRMGPGDVVTAQKKRGRAGVTVKWDVSSTPKQGVVTAGHVVGTSPRATVRDYEGSVAFAVDFINSGTVQRPDVAVIEVSDQLDAGFTTAGIAQRGDQVDIIVGGELKRTEIVTGSDEGIFMRRRAGTAGHVYLASPSVTKGGDSGALVINERKEVVGHLVGGSGAEFDFIQAIHYQLDSITLPKISL